MTVVLTHLFKLLSFFSLIDYHAKKILLWKKVQLYILSYRSCRKTVYNKIHMAACRVSTVIRDIAGGRRF